MSIADKNMRDASLWILKRTISSVKEIDGDADWRKDGWFADRGHKLARHCVS
jgi:hypothetical protein